MAITTQQVEIVLEKLREKFPDWNSFGHPDFVAEEVTYKQKAVAKAKELLAVPVLQDLIARKEYDEIHKRIKSVAHASNLLFLAMPKNGDDAILQSPNLDKDTFYPAFYDLIHGPGSSPERLNRYLEYVATYDLPNKWQFPTYFLFVCHPESEMFIKPDAVIRPFLKLIQSEVALATKPDPAVYSAILQLAKDLKVGLHQFRPTDMIDIQSVMWVCAKANTDFALPPITAETRFWKVAPGEGAHLWNRCRRDKMIAIGWPALGDIRDLTRDRFLEQRTLVSGHDPDYTPDGMEQLWKFVHEIKPGDRIVANRGFSEVVGFGVVTGPCEYKGDETVHYRHRWPVEWYDTTPRKIEQGGWVRTLVKLDATQFQKLEHAQPIQAAKYYKLAPYSTWWSWDECLVGNIAELGCDDLGDIAELHPKKEFARRVANGAPHFSKADCQAVWELSQIPRGANIVAVERDSGRVLGHGLVSGEYFYDSNAPRFRHRLPVQWQATPAGLVDQAPRRKTVEEIDELLWTKLGGTKTPEPQHNPPDIGPPVTMQKSYPLNQILYGPPGTGKTYNSIERAVEIIDSKKYSSHAEAKVRFDELRSEGRIGFVTFHQSFGYEDFVEGIRPVMGEETSREAHYEIRDGVLKDLSLKAIASSLESVNSQPQAGPNFEQIWEALVQLIEEHPPYEIEGVRASRYRLTVSPRGNLFGDNIQGSAQQPYNASRANIEKVWRQLPDSENPTHNKLHSIIGKGSHTNLIGAVLLELRRIKAQWNPAEYSVQTERKALTIDDAQAYLNGSPDYRLSPDGPRYMLIIDEINRGNISKILGELITLLEPDKRSGGDNALTVTLPHSGESFTVPSNLYILGTMNTADKSLALLDVALRRRFKFIEYSPDFTVSTCPQLPETARRVLLQLNHRIVLSKDRDHRIGHSFFVGVKALEEFNDVFRFEIIPLLQEYFYSDWDGLRFVLGEDGENGKFIRALKAEKTRGVRNRWQWYFDERDDPDFDCLQTLTTNYFSKPPTEPSDANEG